MYLRFDRTTMNYESLGRYTESKELAAKLAIEVATAMAGVNRLTGVSGAGQIEEAREHDFAAIRRKLDEAEAAYEKMMVAITSANQAAPECQREPIKLRKW